VTLYLTGFDSYNPILQNKLLPGILDDVSKTSPPTPPLQRWTLDALFLLPYARLRYYRKLYTRLLQSTSEGRSDHRMLHDASRRLEALVTDIEARLECDVSEEDAPPGGKPLPTPVDAPREPSSTTASAAAEQQRSTSRSDSSVETQSVLSAFKVDSTRSSATSAATSVTQSPGGKEGTPVQTSDTPPITDLELRINPERAIDLFNMQPRVSEMHNS
jgi:hypothetical protein